MKKIANFRSFVFSALSLVMTVFACVVALNVPWLGALLLLVPIVAPTVSAFVLRRKLKRYKFVTLVMTSCLCLVCTAVFFVRVSNWTPSEIADGKEYSIAGYVEDVYSYRSDNLVIVKDVTLDGKSVRGRLELTVNGDCSDVAVGERISLRATVYINELYSGFSVDGGEFRDDVRYSAKQDIASIKFRPAPPDLLGVIKNFVKRSCTEFMGEEAGAIAYGIITGNKNDISYSTFRTFSGAGIAHILAVSGLHIGFLSAIVTFVLRKLRVRRLPTFVANAIILFAYALLAGFSPSVTRACLMFLVGSGAMLFGEQKDALNSLGVAVTFMLAFSPLILFDPGFIMSVGAVFGMINFTPMFRRGLSRVRIPRRVTDAVTFIAGAQLGALPATMYFFGAVQTYSFVANIVLMPLMSLAFGAVFVTLILSVIPPLSFLLQISGVFVEAISAAAGFFSGLPFATVTVTKTALVFGLYPLYLLMADFLNLPHGRAVRIGSFMAATFLFVLLLLI